MKGLIDIGAHFAEEYFEIPEADRDRYNFLFFEPIVSTFNDMCNRLPRADNIKCFNIALGNKTGEVMMHTETSNKGQSSSVLKPKIHLELYPWVVFNGTAVVKIDKLDNIEYDRSLYDTIHIDVQGYELEVLRGAAESLKFINEITAEVNKVEIYENCSLLHEVDAFLKKHGFERASVHWWHELWGDATYKRV